ncbi:NAD-glutamate dehydrogenase domain-containing protein [Methylocystis parvus]|uniref:NAD-glutamate dehydrogenase domain-containing protein n=1 Tax=Methylocystis parvus TaxID=134 RepID=UPI003C77767E
MERDADLRQLAKDAPRAPEGKALLRSTHIEFPPGYCDLVSPRQRLRDLLMLTRASEGDVLDLRRLHGGSEFDLRIYGASLRALDALTPLLHNLGLPIVDHIQFPIAFGTEQRFVRSCLIRPPDSDGVLKHRTQVVDALAALLSGDAEDDPLNGLASRVGLSWKEVCVLRAYGHYYLQLGVRMDRSRLYEAFLREVEATRLLFDYFATRFRPDGAAAGFDALSDARQRLISALDKVTNLTNDRVLRDMFNLIDATLRTNFYAKDAQTRTLALKIDSLGVISAPAPKPMVEIFVYSPAIEGIHLRGARIARGGIRWSDREHDLRTEILGLMQTQMVKNALIVPQGAKGGFVLKTDSRDAALRNELGKAAYRDFIAALLELTDNLGRVSRADRRDYDGADPYLVVAADKGTGGWSDVANEIARSRGFWLDDAFASGGSNGFHHKRLGITARGAWVCARMHFRELGRNVDEQAFSVVGVGSMDGDVFGNGMLEMQTIRLLGAFSGEHIFIDPNPDPITSYAERRRLFETPRTSWADYDKSKISAGGGVYRRDAKDIELSAEAQSWLKTRNRLVDGEALIRLLLKAPVDLLWMGGVGTYVKASDETDESLGDRANDGARVNASQLRAKVVAEGANLGFTQRARVEYALSGGRINTDALDNSAGVDLSDHEVNLKILLRYAGDSSGAAELRPILDSVTEEVCAAVLDDNYHQSLCVSLERARSVADVTPYMTLADRFEASGQLDRAGDAFPSRRDLSARSDKGLTRPELALLMAYGKLALKRELLEAPGFGRADWIDSFLLSYFPASIRTRYNDRIKTHPLAREISATVICNLIVDQAGAGFLLFGDPTVPEALFDAARAYLFFNEVLEGDRWRKAVRSSDGRIGSATQIEYLLQLEDSLAYLCRWALKNRLSLAPGKHDVPIWREHLRKYLVHFSQSEEASLLVSNAPAASREMFLDRLRDFPFLVSLAAGGRADMGEAARVFEEMVAFLGLRQIASLAAEANARDVWEGELQATIDERLRSAPARLAAIVLQSATVAPDDIFADAMLAARLARLRRLRAEIVAAEPKSVAPFALFASELEFLAEACEAARRVP